MARKIALFFYRSFGVVKNIIDPAKGRYIVPWNGIFLPIQRAVFLPFFKSGIFYYRSKERYFFTDSGLKLE